MSVCQGRSWQQRECVTTGTTDQGDEELGDVCNTVFISVISVGACVSLREWKYTYIVGITGAVFVDTWGENVG